MDTNRALELLIQAIDEIPSLRTHSRGNQQFDLWVETVCNILELTFSKNSREYDNFARAVTVNYIVHSDEEKRGKYNKELDAYETALRSALHKCKLLIEEAPSPIAGISPKAFIAHGGKSESRDKLLRFLTALSVIPLIIEEEPKEGRSVNEQVEYYSEQADCAIILGTADDKELKDGKLYPRRNVYIEIGRFQEKFPKRIIYLLEEGASFPSDISEKLYTPFTKESMDEAFITVARELRVFNILKAIKPQT